MVTVNMLKTYSPTQFLRLLHTSRGKRWDFNSEVHVSLDKERYEAFLTKGLTCSRCGRKASQVHLEVQTRQPNIGCFEPYSEDNIQIQYSKLRKVIICMDCHHIMNKEDN